MCYFCTPGFNFGLVFTRVCMCCQFSFISYFISKPCHCVHECTLHFLLSLLSVPSVLSILSLHLSTPFQYFSSALLFIFSTFPDKHGVSAAVEFYHLSAFSVSLCVQRAMAACSPHQDFLFGQRSCPSYHGYLEKQTFTLHSSNVILRPWKN